jgi:CHAT domain-containing protein/tetratricopeptide (TPR) repeat protein
MSDVELDEMVGKTLAEATRHQFKGETAAALRMLEELESLARPAHHKSLPIILIQKAGWLRELGRTEEAKAALGEADAHSDQLPELMLPNLRMEQAIVARQTGDLKRAESLLDETRSKAVGSKIELFVMSDILANLSSVYADEGRLEDAQTALLTALEYDAKTGDPQALASNLTMLGLLYDDAGDRESARVYLTQSRDIATEAGLVKEASDATHNLAALLDKQGKPDDAKAGFLEALDAAVRAGRRPEIASAKTSLGILSSREGGYEEAQRMFSEAHDLHAELGEAGFCVNDLINLSQNAIYLKDAGASLRHISEALNIAETHGLVQPLWAIHYCMAKAEAAVMQSQPNPDPAGIDDIMASYVKAADSIELLRSGIGRPEERQQLLVDKEEVYSQGMILGGILRRPNFAWSCAERSRGRSFLDSLGEGRLSREINKHPLAVRRDELTKKLLELHDASEPEMRALTDQLRMVRTMIAAKQPAVAAVTETELPRIEDVSALVPPDSAIIEFFVGPGNYVTAFVIKQKGMASMNTLELGKFDLPGTVEQFRAEVQFGVAGVPTGELLFQILFQPVWNAIESVGRLFIVPHRSLHYVPFAALWFKNTGEGPEHLYLCQRFEMSIVPSASYFVRAFAAQKSDADPAVSVVLGNPTHDLPASEIEARSIADLLGVRPFLGDDAVRSRVLGLTKRQAVIHIASHGVYESRDPLLSGIILADGRVSVEDLLDAHIPANLLVLSGCLTGMSAQQSGDELTGLARTALAAGAPSVVTTLWEVGDDPTRAFFRRMYLSLKAGQNKDVALGSAQRVMINDDQYTSPANWAPFILLGDFR